jgi:uncharacterized protein (DUF2342 family)
MQPSQDTIAGLSTSHNRNHTSPELPLLSHISPAVQTAVREAFITSISAGVIDPEELVKAVLTHLHNQMVRHWLPEHKYLRESVLWIIANPVEARELAESLLSQKEGEHAR